MPLRTTLYAATKLLDDAPIDRGIAEVGERHEVSARTEGIDDVVVDDDHWHGGLASAAHDGSSLAAEYP
jgi:hypothetical protein